MCDKPSSPSLLSLLARADTGPAGAPGETPAPMATRGPVTGAGVFMQEGEAVPAAVAGLPLAQALARGEAPASTAAPNAEDTPVPRGSRRRRLWELPSQALCPVIGVCLPMPVLRRKLGKLLGGQALSNDYEMHCGAINECARRGPVSEMLQKELDQRFAIALRQSSQHKTAEALTRWWHAAQQGNDVGGALWGALTHARCDAALQEQILRDIHMLQHQVGAANRADLQRLDELQDEHAVLTRELAQAQSRSTRLLAERARELEASQDLHRIDPCFEASVLASQEGGAPAGSLEIDAGPGRALERDRVRRPVESRHGRGQKDCGEGFHQCRSISTRARMESQI